MKTTLAILILSVALGAFGQSYPIPIKSVDTITNLVDLRPTDGETVSVLNKSGGTNFGPIQFFRHSKASAVATNSNALLALDGGRWLHVEVDGATGGGSVSIDSTGPATNIVSTSSATWVITNGVASIVAVAPIFNGLLMCDDDSTSHSLTVAKLGTNYLLSVSQAAGAPGPYPSSIPLAASDLSLHQMGVRLVGTNYLLEISQ